MSSITKHRLSTEAYLALEETSPYKNEYLAGEIWAMAGASDAHVTITLNLALLLRQQLQTSPCRVYIADMKVKIANAKPFLSRCVCQLRTARTAQYAIQTTADIYRRSPIAVYRSI